MTGMSERDAFVSRYGGVFEHSPWIAERAFDTGLPEILTAESLHTAMVAQFRAGDHGERLAVLKAHPDLAGRLALAGDLTAQSKSEQASAGLDRLTAIEHARFTTLNTMYTKRFGFPFIIAVRGLTKDVILADFEKRILNDAETEFETACAQVERIALLRLSALFEACDGPDVGNA